MVYTPSPPQVNKMVFWVILPWAALAVYAVNLYHRAKRKDEK